jgi:hypothetical protein
MIGEQKNVAAIGGERAWANLTGVWDESFSMRTGAKSIINYLS